MPTSLSSAQVETFRQQGIVHPLRALPAPEAAALHDRYQAHADFIKGRNNQKPHLLFTWLDALVRDPRILDAVESLLGPDLLCWGAQFFAKPPGDAAYVSWHQDATYWGLSSPDVVTAWVALTPSTPRVGLHAGRAGHPPQPGPARGPLRRREPALARPGGRSQGRSGDGRRRRAAAGRDVAASRAALPWLRAEPLAAAAHRLRHPLRADARAPALADPRQRAARARQRRVRPFRARALARVPTCIRDAVARHGAVIDRQLRILYAGAQARGKLNPAAARVAARGIERRRNMHASIRSPEPDEVVYRRVASHRGRRDRHRAARRRSRSASRIRCRRPNRRTWRPNTSPRTSPRAPTAGADPPSSRPSSSAPARTSTR